MSDDDDFMADSDQEDYEYVSKEYYHKDNN